MKCRSHKCTVKPNVSAVQLGISFVHVHNLKWNPHHHHHHQRYRPPFSNVKIRNTCALSDVGFFLEFHSELSFRILKLEHSLYRALRYGKWTRMIRHRYLCAWSRLCYFTHSFIDSVILSFHPLDMKTHTLPALVFIKLKIG